MRLEDLRDDDLGKTIAWFRDGAEPDKLPLTYPDYSIKGFYLTCQSLEQLEQSRTLINQGNTVTVAVAMWFVAIEAYINSLLRIACRLTKTDFTEIKNQDIGTRIRALFDLLSVSKEPFYRSGVFQRFEEFKAFRNELFHDRTSEEALTFYKTSFSRIPQNANQVDGMQALIIALEIFQALRLVYKGLDLMPNILINKDDSFGYVRLDILYRDVVMPLFVGSLEKHSLRSDLMVDPTLISAGESLLAPADLIKVLVKYEQDEPFRLLPNSARTTLGADLFEQVRKGLSFDTKTSFGLANYHRS